MAKTKPYECVSDRVRVRINPNPIDIIMRASNGSEIGVFLHGTIVFGLQVMATVFFNVQSVNRSSPLDSE